MNENEKRVMVRKIISSNDDEVIKDWAEQHLNSLDDDTLKEEHDKIRHFQDYCDNCERYIDQIDVGEGSFGCPLCKRDDCITTFYIDDDDEDKLPIVMKSMDWCCELCGRLIKGLCENTEGYITCLNRDCIGEGEKDDEKN